MDTAGYLRRIATLLERAELEHLPVVELLDRAAARQTEVRAACSRALAEAQELVKVAAAGVAATPESFAEVARAVTVAQNLAEPAKSLRVQTLAVIGAEAVAEFAAAWPSIDTEIIAIHDKAMADLVNLAPKLAGIDDDKAAVAGGPTVATAWAKAAGIAGRRDAMIAVRAAVAELLGLVDYAPTDDLRQYRHPENLRDWPARAVDAPRHRVTRLLDDIDAGAEPALCTDAEVAELAERYADHRPARVNPFAGQPMGGYPQDGTFSTAVLTR